MRRLPKSITSKMYCPTEKVSIQFTMIYNLIIFIFNLSPEHTGVVCACHGRPNSCFIHMQLIIKNMVPNTWPQQIGVAIHHGPPCMPQRCWHQHQIAKYNGQEKYLNIYTTLYHGTLFATYGLSVKSVLPTNYRSVKTFTDGPRTSLQAVSVKLLPTDRCFTDLSSVAKREVLPTLHHLVIIVLPTL